MFTIPLKDRMITYINLNKQITGWTTVAARLTLARQADTITGIDTGRDLD